MAGLATKLILKGEVVKAFTIDAGAASRWTTGAPYGRGVCEIRPSSTSGGPAFLKVNLAVNQTQLTKGRGLMWFLFLR